MKTLRSAELPLPRIRSGKVRELYDAGEHLLLLATDRISAFDCVLPDLIPHKGAVLTQVSRYWFDLTGDVVRNHLVTADPDEIEDRLPSLARSRESWAWRSMLVRKAEPYPVECVVRGYLAGSGWREYRRTGRILDHELPAGLEECAELPEPIFTPATKAEEGHDENITFEEASDVLGRKLAIHLRDRSLALYRFARERAARAGILLADTKFEFGVTRPGEILVIDEMLTPDSSRYWPEEEYETGRAQPSLDKQPVRDYLDTLVAAGEWNRGPPAPTLPDEVIDATSRRYRDLYRRLTGDDLPGT